MNEQMNEWATTIGFPIVRQDFILNALESLHKHTPRDLYKTIVLNQTQINPEFEEALYDLCDIVIRPHLNYGFAQGGNILARLAPSPFVTISNDDMIFLENWYEGIIETFQKFPKALVVAPRSTKDPGWGWGEPGFRYMIPTENDPELKEILDVYNDAKEDLIALEKKWRETKDELPPTERQWLHESVLAGQKKLRELENSADEATLKASQNPKNIKKLIEGERGSVIDGIAMWNVTFKRKEWEELGMFDERFKFGGGEDYDACARLSQAGYRALATSFSWCFHYWGASKDKPNGFKVALPGSGEPWNCLSTKGFGEMGLWRDDVDVWGRTGVRTTKIVHQAPL